MYDTLTVKPFDLAYDRKMLGRSRLCEMCTGDFRCRDSSIAVTIEGGAEADRAIKGTLATALKPPMLLKASRNTGPLQHIHFILIPQ